MGAKVLSTTRSTAKESLLKKFGAEKVVIETDEIAPAVKDIFPDDSFPEPQKILDTNIEKFRSTGVSYRKAEYINNIAQAFLDDPDTYLNLEKKNDGDIINSLTSVKGIGLWTAQMFLMFTLNP